MQEITGKPLVFHPVDLLDREALDAVFVANPIDAVIHFAALKAPGESVSQPLRYYHNNITGTIVLCQVMAQHGVKNLVFSSSATLDGSLMQRASLLDARDRASFQPVGHGVRAGQDIGKERVTFLLWLS